MRRSNRTLLPAGRSAPAATSPRVLLLITGNQRRGAESSACALADELDRRGMSARVLALAPSDVPNALPVETLGSTPLAAATLWNLRREIRSADVASVLAGLGTGRPVVYQNIGDPLFWAGTPGRRLRVRALLRRTAAVGALTEQSASALETHFGVPPDRIRGDPQLPQRGNLPARDTSGEGVGPVPARAAERRREDRRDRRRSLTRKARRRRDLRDHRDGPRTRLVIAG